MRSTRRTVIIMRRRQVVGQVQVAGRVLMPDSGVGMCMQLKAGNARKPNRQHKHAEQKPAVPSTRCVQGEVPHR